MIGLAVGLLLLVAVTRPRVGRQPPAVLTAVTHVDPTSLAVAPGSRRIVAADGRNEFQVLLADLRTPGETGADRLRRLQRIAETQPALAIDLAMALGGDHDEKASWVTELTRTWAGRDAQAAWAWLGPQMARMEPLTGNSLIGVILNEMAAQTPQRVIDDVDALLWRGPLEGEIPALVARQLGLTALLAHGDLDIAKAAVEEWVRNPRAQPVDASAFNVVAGAIAQNSWDDATAWLATLPPSNERNAAFAGLASKWADADPNAALDWAETLGEESGRAAAIGTVFADWVERDQARAGDWLLGYIDRAKSDAEIDALLGRFVTFSPGLQRDPALATGWVELMRDTAQRDTATERVIARWGRRDLAAATRYVDTAPELSAAQRQSLKANLLALPAESDPVME